ncbi:hypothetical protein MO867_21630 [Microbulbifer sp. OS29]|uniref:Uncharacterized protein n=1 Tax=Microbulbifer okhotskensis TaxID=2926617 RepID=A0A9X2ERB5_9GAMM|nr:hypothetical protein [Microbulbifer okhotskensis]MCO1336932.1 hypothetical protein [Microbulbifer okhotskensis]
MIAISAFDMSSLLGEIFEDAIHLSMDSEYASFLPQFPFNLATISQAIRASQASSDSKYSSEEIAISIASSALSKHGLSANPAAQSQPLSLPNASSARAPIDFSFVDL